MRVVVVRRVAAAVGAALAALAFGVAVFALLVEPLTRLVTWVYRQWDAWITYQGASREQRAQWRKTRRLNGNRFDWVPTDNDLRSSK